MKEVKQAEKTSVKPYINIKKVYFKAFIVGKLSQTFIINRIETNTVIQPYNLVVIIKD